jgi:CheY-like chemotaxis protein
MATILIVDDEEGFRHILQVVLQRAGHQIISAGDAVQAQQAIQANRIDLIILDDMMPGMSGSDLCLQIKSDPLLRHIPVLMHSANPKLHNKAFVESIGADGVLLKPTTPRDVTAAVSSILQANV